MNKWVLGKVVGHKQWTKGLFSLYVEAPIDAFIAGQFTQIRLGEQSVFRPYSFANAPSEGHLEFYYIVVEQGEFTTALIQLKEGDDIWVAQKASGRFILADVPSSELLWLFATGTGLGVFLSLLKTPEPWERFKQIILVHSARYHDELTHQEIIKKWQVQYPDRFHWVPIVTREPTEKPHLSKRIPTLLTSEKLEESLGLHITQETSQVMLCGNPHMVKEVSHLLQERGLLNNRFRQPGQITVEKLLEIG